MEIRLTAIDDGSTAEGRTPDGVFSGPDHLIDIVDLRVRHGARAAPASAPVPLPVPRRETAAQLAEDR
ncbi:hypothetical protein ACFVYF_23790 [Streptomyces sp. NPDC058274]|uniref:hypothetical protein n=1 Tax=Streptomyces sp. NPDC058274 TaxID=3346416 RepID=UPI0036E2C3B2